MPLSFTLSTASEPSARKVTSIRPPLLVNFTELFNRFHTICCRRSGSPEMGPTRGSNAVATVRPFAADAGRTASTAAWITIGSSTLRMSSRQMPCDHARHVQQIFDELCLRTRIALDDFERVGVLLLVEIAASEQPHPPEDGVQRRAQLVRDGGDELVLAAIEGLGFATRLLLTIEHSLAASFCLTPIRGIAKHQDDADERTVRTSNRSGAVFNGRLAPVTREQQRVIRQPDNAPFTEHLADWILDRAARVFRNDVEDRLDRLPHRSRFTPAGESLSNRIQQRDASRRIGRDYGIADASKRDRKSSFVFLAGRARDPLRQQRLIALPYARIENRRCLDEARRKLFRFEDARRRRRDRLSRASARAADDALVIARTMNELSTSAQVTPTARMKAPTKTSHNMELRIGRSMSVTRQANADGPAGQWRSTHRRISRRTLERDGLPAPSRMRAETSWKSFVGVLPTNCRFPARASHDDRGRVQQSDHSIGRHALPAKYLAQAGRSNLRRQYRAHFAGTHDRHGDDKEVPSSGGVLE